MTNGIDESLVRGRGIKIGLIVALLVVAGFITYAQSRTDIEQPDTPDTVTTFVCMECNHAIDITAAEYADMVRAQTLERDQASEPGRGGSQLRCPKCEKPAMILGTRCPNDGTPVPQQTKDGKPGRCPKCGWTIFGR